MPGPTVEMEAVEPQSLKKLSFKSLKRALDLFSPLHSHLAPPDPERSQQKTIINAMAVNEEGVMATGGDNGSMWFWDWKSGHNFQQSQTIVQPGSLDSEAGIYALSYDLTGSRLITCEADKTIKMWKQDETATPETHPLNFKPPKDIRRF
nr:protein pleiotropic regulatory locus 1 [Quercus suber]